MNHQIETSRFRLMMHRLAMLMPVYRRLLLLEEKIDRQCTELKHEIDAAKFVDRTEEIKRAVDAAKFVDRTEEIKQAIDAAKFVDRSEDTIAAVRRILQEYHEHLGQAQDEILAAMDRVSKLIVADDAEENRKQLESIGMFQQLSTQFASVRQEAIPAVQQVLSAEIKAHAVDLLRDNIRSRWQMLHTLEPILYPDSFPVRCLVCGHIAPKSTYQTKTANCFFGGGQLKRFVCPECGCIFGPLKMMAMEDGMLGLEYSQHYHVYEEGDSSWKERLAFQALKPRRGGKYLNFGAGAWSKTTIQLRQEGWDVYDYEPYAPFDNRDWVFRTTDVLNSHTFDGIFSNDVLEHFRDPIHELRQMKALLNRGGTMAHCTGCYEYAFEYTRFHFVFFTGRSLEVVSQAIGMNHDLSERLRPDDPTRICLFSQC